MLGHQTYQRLRFVRVQLVYDEDPTGLDIGGDDRFDVVSKILLGTRRPHRGGDDAPGGHTKTGNQGQRAVANVLKLTQFDVTSDHRAIRVHTLKGLYAGLFVGRDDIDAGLGQGRGRQVQGTDRRDSRVKALGIFSPLVIEPIPTQMGLEIGLVLKNAPHCGGKSA